LVARLRDSILSWKFVSTMGISIADLLVEIFRQLPAKELGDAIRDSATPGYLRAGATLHYNLALLDGNPYELKEALDVIQAPDADLNREIRDMLHRHPAEEMGRELQQKVAEAASLFKDIFGNEQLAQELETMLPAAFRAISWLIGYRLKQNLEYNPERVKVLLKALNSHNEIAAIMEQYRYKYAWQGDRDKATTLAWQTVAPRYFHLSAKIENIKEDEDQERLIGTGQGLEKYTAKNPAIVGLKDGLRGRLGAYLKKAAEHERIDYIRKQNSDGNRIQTEGEHISDLRHPDNEEDEGLSDEEVLSRENERPSPSRDAIVEELERKETIKERYSLLTEREKTVVKLKSQGYREEEIATIVGISQQRVSQLLRGAWAKWAKIKNSS
jgi:RNA polymerase sigma factor (sigma-70 family)